MTDTAFRRLVKRRAAAAWSSRRWCSSEGLVRGIDRTLEYAEYTEEERPVSIQIFGGDPEVMADAAQIVEGMGADIVDINMGCPVPKIAKHNAGCSLMREPAHAASVVRAMAKRGADSGDREDARRLERAARSTRRRWRGWSKTPARRRSPCTAARPRSPTRASPTGRSSARVAEAVTIPVFGSGDCVEPGQIVSRVADGRGRRRARRPRRAAQSVDLRAGGGRRGRGQADGRCPSKSAASSCSSTSICCWTSASTKRAGFRHAAPGQRSPAPHAPARGRERWVINKLRALGSWYTKGLDGGSHLRVAINSAESIAQLREMIEDFFLPSAT